MVAPVASTYTVGAGLPIWAGRLRPAFGAGAALGGVVAGSALSGGAASAFGAGAALGAVAAGGTLAGAVPPALQEFIQGLTPGVWTQYTSPSLTANDATGSPPFDAVPGIGSAGIFDWCSSLQWDPVSRRMAVVGGRPFFEPGAAKLIVYDANTDAWTGKADPFNGVGAGHIYQHNTIAPSLRRLFFSSFTVGNRYEALDIDTLLPASPATIPPTPGSTIKPGKPTALIFMPNSGTAGWLCAVGVTAGDQGAQRWRWDFGTGASLGNDYLDGDEFDGYGTDETAVYSPEGGGALVGKTEPTSPKRLLVMEDDGTMRWTATSAPFSYGVDGSSAYKCSASAHPTRGAVVVVCGITDRMWTYEFASDAYVDRGDGPAWAANANHAMWTIPEWDALVAIVASSNGTVANQMWVYRVGSTLG